MAESSYDSFSNLVIQPTGYESSSVSGAGGLDQVVNRRRSDDLAGRIPKSGGFGSITTLAISKDDNRDLLDFVFFLENHNVKIVPAKETAKAESHAVGFQGTSMEVFPGTWQGRKVALKYVRKAKLPDSPMKNSNPPEYRRLLRLHQARQKDIMFEIKIMARGHFYEHPNIVKLFAVFFEDEELLPGEANIYSPGMIVELADQQHPDLEIYLQSSHRPLPLPFGIAAGIIADIADGLAALHSYGVIHADLKPSNVLLFATESGDGKLLAKVADFGFCGIMSSDDTTRGGTSYWKAPENIIPTPQMPRDSYITDPSDFYRDIYSFGLVVAIVALDGKLPFSAEVATRLKLEDGVVDVFADRIHHQANVSQYKSEQVQAFKEIATKTLVRDERKRITTLTCVRMILFPREGPLVKSSAGEIVPFSLLESLTQGDETRYARGWQYPTAVSQYANIPQTVIGKLDEILTSVDLDAAAPPVVAQCFFWAEARMEHISSRKLYLEMSRIVYKAADKMKAQASINQPDFASVPHMMKDSSNRGFETDLVMCHMRGDVDHPILTAIQLRDANRVKELLDKDDPAPRALFRPNWGCFHAAAYYDGACVMVTLLESGLEIDAPAGDNIDTTPLAVAARKANVNSVRELLRLGAKVDPPFTGILRIPLREAIMFSDDSRRYVETIESLLKAGASSGHAGFGTAAVHNAAHLPNTVEVMLRYNPESINYRDLARATPLHHAVKRLCKRSVQIMLLHGADVNARDECGFTPLHSACRMQSRKKFEFHGAELEQFIRDLAVGTREDGEEIARMLKDAGADIDAPLFDGLYGAEPTPDSFLYDRTIDVSEITIPFCSFTCVADSDDPMSEGFVPVPCLSDEGSSNPSSAPPTPPSSVMVSVPRRGNLRHQYILRDVLPNSYELIVCFGWVNRQTCVPPSHLAFQMHAEPETQTVSVIMGGYLQPLTRLCPEGGQLYTVKFQEFSTFARRHIRIEAMVLAPKLDAVIGGLLVKWVRIQRVNVSQDEFSLLWKAALRPGEVETVASVLDKLEGESISKKEVRE